MHNLAIPVETVVQNVFDSVSIDVLCNILAKQALEVGALTRGSDLSSWVGSDERANNMYFVALTVVSSWVHIQY